MHKCKKTAVYTNANGDIVSYCSFSHIWCFITDLRSVLGQYRTI